MFENLSERLGGVFDRLTKQGALSEEDVKTALREVRVALLEGYITIRESVQFHLHRPVRVELFDVHVRVELVAVSCLELRPVSRLASVRFQLRQVRSQLHFVQALVIALVDVHESLSAVVR